MDWRPIETAPRDGRPILTYRGAGLMAVAEPYRAGWKISDGMKIINVTHWMPLPKPPTTNLEK